MNEALKIKEDIGRHMAFESIRTTKDEFVAVRRGFSTKPRAMSEHTKVQRVYRALFGKGVKVEVDYPDLPGDRLKNVSEYTITLRVPRDAARAS